MKFLVIGASGFVGRNLLAHFHAQGFAAIGTQAHSREKGLATFDLLRHRITDSIDPSFFQGPEPVNAVISAVISDMDLCLTDRIMAHAVNVEKTIQLINELANLNARITFLSTCFVFDGKTGYYNEASPVSPANEYGRHKAEVEDYLRSHAPGAFVPRMDKIVRDNPLDRQLLRIGTSTSARICQLFVWKGHCFPLLPCLMWLRVLSWRLKRASQASITSLIQNSFTATNSPASSASPWAKRPMSSPNRSRISNFPTIAP